MQLAVRPNFIKGMHARQGRLTAAIDGLGVAESGLKRASPPVSTRTLLAHCTCADRGIPHKRAGAMDIYPARVESAICAPCTPAASLDALTSAESDAGQPYLAMRVAVQGGLHGEVPYPFCVVWAFSVQSLGPCSRLATEMVACPGIWC